MPSSPEWRLRTLNSNDKEFPGFEIYSESAGWQAHHYFTPHSLSTAQWLRDTLNDRVSELERLTTAERKASEYKEALEAEQVAVELHVENYRQADNGWLPSPSYDRVLYPDVSKARDRAHELRLSTLGITDYQHKEPSNISPHFYVVERRYDALTKPTTEASTTTGPATVRLYAKKFTEIATPYTGPDEPLGFEPEDEPATDNAHQDAAELRALVEEAREHARAICDAGVRTEMRARGISAGDYAASVLDDWSQRADALLARTAATPAEKKVCRFYGNEPCPLPNVQCSAPDCMISAATQEPGS